MSTRAGKEVLFFERQFMPTWSIVLVIGVGLVLPVFLILVNGAHPILLFLVAFLLLTFAVLGTMQTRVRRDEIEISFGLIPLISYRYGLHMIEGFAVRKYAPLKEYGGWGIKGWRLNRALNMRGNMGVQMQMLTKDNQPWKLLVGSARPEELQSAIAQAKN